MKKIEKEKIFDYPFTIRPLSKEEGSGYLIEFPDLPGCMSDGETIEEALKNGYDSVFSWINAFRDSNRSSVRIIPIPEIFRGENISIVPMSLTHADGLFKAAQPKEIWTWLPWKPFQSKGDVLTWMRDGLNKNNQIPFTIFSSSNTIIGSTRYLEIDKKNRSLEIGSTWLNPNYWNASINSECKYLLLQHVFETLEFNRVQLKTDVRNIRSQKAIEKLGAKKEGVLRSSMLLPDGYRRDSVYYSILREEWFEDIKQKLRTIRAPNEEKNG